MADFSLEFRGRSGVIVGTPDLHAVEVQMGGALFRTVLEDPDADGLSGVVALPAAFRMNSQLERAIRPSTCVVGGVGPFVLSDGMTLELEVAGDPVPAITFNTADFIDIGAATVDEVIAVANTDLAGAAVARRVRNLFVIHPADEREETIQVVGGTAVAALGLDTDLHSPYTTGAEADFDWSIISTQNDDDGVLAIVVDPAFDPDGDPAPSLAAWSAALG